MHFCDNLHSTWENYDVWSSALNSAHGHNNISAIKDGSRYGRATRIQKFYFSSLRCYIKTLLLVWKIPSPRLWIKKNFKKILICGPVMANLLKTEGLLLLLLLLKLSAIITVFPVPGTIPPIRSITSDIEVLFPHPCPFLHGQVMVHNKDRLVFHTECL